MNDQEWVEVVASARARYATEPFNMQVLYTGMRTLSLLGDVEYELFLQDARSRAAQDGALQELEDGSWRWTGFVLNPGEQVGPDTDPAQAPAVEPAGEQAQEPVQTPAGSAPGDQPVVAVDIVVERQGAGTWAIWDSRVGAWAEGGKEAETIKKGREIAKTAANEGHTTRLRVVGMNRNVKQERVYQAGSPKARSTNKPPKSKPAPARPPLPGEQPAPIVEPEPAPVLVQEPAAAPAQGNASLDYGPGTINAQRSTLVLFTSSTGEHVAIDARQVSAIESCSQGTRVYVQGATFVLSADLLRVVYAINDARG